jgi:hypothetical protein
MLSDQELFHGAAFARLFRRAGSVTVTHAADVHSSAYLIETEGAQVAVLFKVNRVRKKSPWQFTFSAAESDALARLRRDHSIHRRFVALICRLDGVCCLSEEQLFDILGDELEGRAVSVRRPREGSYHVTGPERRKLKGAVPKSAWPLALFTA